MMTSTPTGRTPTRSPTQHTAHRIATPLRGDPATPFFRLRFQLRSQLRLRQPIHSLRELFAHRPHTPLGGAEGGGNSTFETGKRVSRLSEQWVWICALYGRGCVYVEYEVFGGGEMASDDPRSSYHHLSFLKHSDNFRKPSV